MGSTDKPVSFDPAGSYDNASWLVMHNVYQTLLTIAPGGTTPVPDAAKRCRFISSTTYACVLKPKLHFSNGSLVTSRDVAYSINRILHINSPNAPASLFGSIGSITTPRASMVVFHLKKADGTFPYVLTTPAASIVPHAVFPANKLLPDAKIIGSGPYELAKYQPGVQVALKANPSFSGRKPKTPLVLIQYFENSSALKLAIQQGAVDIAYNTLAPTDIRDLAKNKALQVIRGNGAEVAELMFNLKFSPGSNAAVRKAIAYTINRASIATNVYGGTVKPVYSMVPAGFAGHIDAFATAYGRSPNIAKARQTLQQANVQTPVALQMWYTTDHYGATSADEFTEIKRQLDASGLFKVTLNSSAWADYSKAAFQDQYPIYQLGWFGDYPEADNFLAPFYSSHGFFNIHFSDPTMDALLAQEERLTNEARRVRIIRKVQTLAAKDVPVIPLWQAQVIAVVRRGVTGVRATLDPSNQFRFWLVSKK